jgi:hypothetical protein
MTPRHVGCITGFGDYSWKHRIARETFPFVDLAGIHIRLPRVSCSIYQKLRLVLPQSSGEDGEVRIVEL